MCVSYASCLILVVSPLSKWSSHLNIRLVQCQCCAEPPFTNNGNYMVRALCAGGPVVASYCVCARRRCVADNRIGAAGAAALAAALKENHTLMTLNVVGEYETRMIPA